MLSRFRTFFQRSLKNYPVLTNVTVYGSFYAAAELSQQTFNRHYSVDKPDYDFASAARIVGVGSTLYAPTLYYWYKYLDSKFVGTTMKTVLTKVACDQFLMTPVLLASFFVALSVLERREDIFAELRAKYWTAFTANQAFWIPSQTINFWLMPPHLRVVYVSALAFIWINVLCYIKRQSLNKTVEKQE